MRLGSLSAELDAITREFDYGIVPGSATVFVKDEVNGIGRLDLTLLEGVMIVLEVTDEGYKVNWNSCWEQKASRIDEYSVGYILLTPL